MTQASKIQKTIKILEYKLLFQEKEKVFLEFEEGSIDLNYRLSFFEKQLDKTIPAQVELYKKKFSPAPIFIPENIEDDIKDTQNNETNNNNNQNENDSNLIIDHPDWIKKLYRKVISVTHPDKTSGINSKEIIKNYTDYYYLTVSSLESQEYENIVMIANDLTIDLGEIDEKVFNNLFEKGILTKRQEIKDKKNLTGFQWYHVPEDKKDYHLKLILTNLGFIFSEEKIQEAVHSKRPVNNSRKPGERPEKGIRERRNK